MKHIVLLRPSGLFGISADAPCYEIAGPLPAIRHLPAFLEEDPEDELSDEEVFVDDDLDEDYPRPLDEIFSQD